MKEIILKSVNIVPIAAIIFTILLCIYKLYIKIRSKFKVQVNCWFCNENNKVEYNLRNSWNCPSCEQYNGFTRDGDYNKEIPIQRQGVSFTIRNSMLCHDKFNSNGFCESCNENQRIKVEKLAQFEPKKEKNFNEELTKYKKNLEEKYRLCVSCERHLGKTLREKKKIIIGSKLAALLTKKVSVVKSYTSMKNLKHLNKSYFKNFCSLCLLIVAVLNFVISTNDLIENNKNTEMHNTFSRAFYIIIAHVVTLIKVITAYLENVWNTKLVEKIYLYIKTIALLCFYSLGFQYKGNILNLSAIGFASLPFGSILLAFINNILDGFKFGKNTFLLTVWSIYAGVVNNTVINDIYSTDILRVIVSFFAIILSFSNFLHSEKPVVDNQESSFHRIYSEDYTAEMDSKDSIHNISFSSNSTKSWDSKDKSPKFSSPVNYMNRTSSVLSLNTTPLSAFKQYSMQSPLSPKSVMNFSNFDANTTRSTFNSDYIRPLSRITLNSASSYCVAPVETNFNQSMIAPYRQTSNFGPVNQGLLNDRFSCSSPPVSPLPNFRNHNYRQNLLSPSRLSCHTPQTSWVSGGYFNKNVPIEKRNYFLATTGTNDNLSRGSSQSSGFESQGSSTQSGDQSFSRENSCFRENDGYSNQLEAQFHFDQMHYTGHAAGNAVNTTYNSLSTNKYPEKTLKYLNCSLTPPCSSPLNSSLCDTTIKPIAARKILSAFDLNKMGEDLPSIQRGNLLNKWRGQNAIL